ncbi:MAG: sulfite exporter TauE/SafE family protein [Opitutaceae bacterium]|nr:sulfite exporter TauE/SafE family protein [Opitutaceae bacterium]
MTFAPIDSSTAAFVAGLVTSLHCAGMCGPLACLLAPAPGSDADPATTRSIYHVSRLASYTLLGAVAGGLGRVPLSFLGAGVVRWVPWLMVLLLLALAFRWEKRLPRPAILARFSLRLPGMLRRRGPLGGAALLGAATPLLPCGPLYFVLATSSFAGSALRGAEWMLTFGLGTVPLLWLAQTQAGWLRRKLGPAGLARVQVGLALVAALVVAWRLRGTLGFAGPNAGSFVCF